MGIWFPVTVYSSKITVMNYWNEKEIKNIILNEFNLIIKDNKSLKVKDLIDFHAKNKYLYFCYDQKTKDILGRVVANKTKDIKDTYNDYYVSLKLLFEKNANSKNILNSILHMYGYFKRDITDKEKKEFFELVERYKNMTDNLFEILKKIENFAVKYDKKYIAKQTILTITKNKSSI